MKKNQGTKFIISLLCALMLIFSPITGLGVHAVSQNDIDELQKELDELEQKIADQQEIIDSLTQTRSFLVDRKLALDQKIELNRQQIRIIGNQVELYNKILAEKAEDLEKALETEETQGTLLRSRMRAMEENGNLSYVMFLFDSDSLTDLLSRMADISDIMQYDKRIEGEFISLRENAEEIKASYEATFLEQEALQKELDAKQKELDAQIEAAYLMIANLDEHTDNAEAEWKALAEKEAETEEAISKLLRQRAAEQARATGGVGGGGSGGGGSGSASGISGLTWPCPSCNIITSAFGPRVQPTQGASTYHCGIDIGAQMGAGVVSAAAGTVILAQFNYGKFGNCVMVDHGNGLATLYGHLDSISVSYGQSVSSGQLLGSVGSTGISTGPHLHFEVRVNGAPTDPAQYYSGLTYY